MCVVRTKAAIHDHLARESVDILSVVACFTAFTPAPDTCVVAFSLALGNVVGFMLDIGFASSEGVAVEHVGCSRV